MPTAAEAGVDEAASSAALPERRAPEEPRAGRAVQRVERLGDRVVAVDLGKAHWTYPLPFKVSTTRSAGIDGSAASGAGFMPRRSRIHAAWRDSTDTILAAAASDGLVRFGACAV